MNQYWAWWLLGMGLMLGIKIGFYLHKSDPFRYSFAVKILMFFGDGPKAVSKSVLGILAELAMGSVYVNRLPLPYGPLGELPLDSVLCIFLGAASELAAPWLVGKIAGMFGKEE